MSQLTELVKELANLCLDKGLKIVTAESCTAGGVAFELTALPGSSKWFERGFVTYSNYAKIEMLGVSKTSIEMYGAVSREVALQMAEGAIRHSHANVSIAITGIAGPDGGTMQKPVGTCWFAWAGSLFPSVARREIFSGNRDEIRSSAIFFAVDQLSALIRK